VQPGIPLNSRIHLAFVAAVFLSLCNQAIAALGDVRPSARAQFSSDSATRSVSSLQTDSSDLINSERFSKREVALETGTIVVEYMDSGGRVFAISWAGPVLPPLNQWLGAYYSLFSEAVALDSRPSSLGTPLGVTTDKLVVKSRGRMRNFSGYAYVPAWVPAGLRIQDVLP
jgi:hypothetical protein